MSSTNEIWLTPAGHRVRLDLDDETALLPSFQANDRTKPDTIQSDYSPEFSAPGTVHNHQLLKHAAASQPVQGSAYARVPCVLTSGGVETLPIGLLYIKGYKEGRYQLQLFGGNKRLVEALGDKKLADLDLNRFNHYWTAADVLARLPYDYWAANGYGYEVYDRGKPLDLKNLDPFTLYPACSGNLVWQQILADAGFTADSLLTEPLAAQLDVPTANPYTYSQEYRDARQLTAGFFYAPNYDPSKRIGGILHEAQFAAERLNFSYTERKPYHLPDPASTSATYFGGRYTADTLGYYDLAGSVALHFGCRVPFPGSVRAFVELRVNGKPIFDPASGLQQGKDEAETKDYITKTFTPKLDRYKLNAGDYVELWWRGDEINQGLYGIGPTDPRWQIGPWGGQVPLDASNPTQLQLATEVRFKVTLLPDFPPGGLVRLQDWLPDMKQLDFVKAYMELLGLTIQADAYEPHLHLATGNKLLANVPYAKNWSAKRDAYAHPGRLPERDLAFRFGSYGQTNVLKWAEDEHVTKGYGDGTIAVADEVLPTTYELATLPFAATEASASVPGLLRIANFEVADFTANPITYTSIEAKPRLTLRTDERPLLCELITTPATDKWPAVTASVETTGAIFDGPVVSLVLDRTVLTVYWADLRAMLDESRYLVERYRLTPQDLAELDFSVPIWDSMLGDFFAVSVVGEYDASRPVEVKLCRLNAKYLPPPALADADGEFWEEEFYTSEFYG
jgi:hypothetical protein